MARACFAAALLGSTLAIACDTGEIPHADAGPGDGDGGVTPGDDGGGGGEAALEFEWRTMPSVPGSSGGPWDATYDRVLVRLADVRAVGDAALLSRAEFEMEFTEDERYVLRFDQAPPGMYATLIGHVAEIQVEGTVRVGPQTEDFEIDDQPPPATSFAAPLGYAVVEAGKTERIKMRIDIAAVVDAIDWSAVEKEDGTLEVSTGDDEVDAMRAALVTAIRRD
jgi:hypothetical protein